MDLNAWRQDLPLPTYSDSSASARTATKRLTCAPFEHPKPDLVLVHYFHKPDIHAFWK
jgi:hypothetical protein